MAAAVNNRDEGKSPIICFTSTSRPGEAGMEHTLPIRFLRDAREGKWQNNELKKLQTRSLVVFISV